MYYIIYKTINNINGKIYIGKHKTKNLNDRYLGSGKLLQLAIKKYGIENFTREIIHVFDTEQEMNLKEREIVTEEFCLRDDTYNMCVGGLGGFSYVNRSGLNYTNEKNKKISPLGKPEFVKKYKNDIIKGSTLANKKRLELVKQGLINLKTFLGKTHTDETKQKMSMAKKGKATGNENSQYGSMWITNGTANQKIKKDSSIPEGWYKGRTI